jgi:hypothetical protein
MSLSIQTRYKKDEFEHVSEYLALSMMYSFESLMDSGDFVEIYKIKERERTSFVNEGKRFVISFQACVFDKFYSSYYEYYPHLQFYVKGSYYIYPFPTKYWWIFKEIDETKTVYKKYLDLKKAMKHRVDELKEEEIKKKIGDKSP